MRQHIMTEPGNQPAKKSRVWILITGVLGINVVYLVYGVILQRITKVAYKNNWSNRGDLFHAGPGLIMLERGTYWILAFVCSQFMSNGGLESRKEMKNVELVGFLVVVSSATNLQAIVIMSYPLTQIFRSSSVLVVVLVGVFCSSVSHHPTKLPPQKLITGIVMTAGIVLYKVFDAQTQPSDHPGQRWLQVLGIVYMIISLFADGFVADYRQQIKLAYQPTPIFMLQEISKWATIVCFVYSILRGNFFYTFSFCFTYPEMALHLSALCMLGFVGQIFAFRLVKEFKQHIVPYVLSGKELLTVILSIIIYHHKICLWQIVGVAIVFFAIFVQMYLEVCERQEQTSANNSIYEQIRLTVK